MTAHEPGGAERGGPCGPIWASPTHLSSSGPSGAGPIRGFPDDVAAGSEPAKLFAAPVDDPEINVGKPDEPVAGFGFGNADGLADERLAEKNPGAAPTDLAIGAQLAHGVISVVPRAPPVLRAPPMPGARM